MHKSLKVTYCFYDEVCRPEFGLWRLEFALYLPTKGFNVWMLQKSFKRDSYFDWRMYSHIVLRVRGDGRSYMLNIATMGYYDIMWNDIYSYALFTRGGPYWQLSKVKQRGQTDRLCNSVFLKIKIMWHFFHVSECQNSFR
jgi:hypothetical protein